MAKVTRKEMFLSKAESKISHDMIILLIHVIVNKIRGVHGWSQSLFQITPLANHA